MARIPGIDVAFAAASTAAGQASAAAGRASGLVRSATTLVAEARETVQAYHRLARRADALITDLEEPLRELAPGLRRLATVLDDPLVDDLPSTLRQVQHDLLPVLRTLADTHERVAFVAGLPGAALLGRRRTVPPRTITVEQV